MDGPKSSVRFCVFLTCLVAVPTAIWAQTREIVRIGYFSAASPAANAPRLEAFRQGMKDLGWTEGKHYSIDARYADSLASINKGAADLVASKPDLILTPTDEAIKAVAKATRTIPIVFATAFDPVRIGVVKSLQRPATNVTGVTIQSAPLSAKRGQLLKEAFPEIGRMAVLFPSDDPAVLPQVADLENAADRLRVKVDRIEIRDADDIGPGVSRARASGSQGFVVVDGYLFNSQRKRLVDAVRASKLPAIFARAEHVEAGGLMSYGASGLDNFRRSAGYVDKILKGAKPGDMPVELPTKFDLVVNLRTAKEIGLTIPSVLSVRADRILE
jgi:ABC-type uncharacterized transport system substrate-binding protein